MVDVGLEIVVALKSGEGKVDRSYTTEDGKGDRWLDLIDCLRDITEGKVSLFGLHWIDAPFWRY